MHKFFAKTVFLGKSVQILPICHSTNELAKEQYRQSDIHPGAIWWCDDQTAGKGQMGNSWLSSPARNLLFTIYLSPDYLSASNQYLMNLAVSVALCDTLRTVMPMAQVEVKWPNDLYLNDRKVAGILTESFLSGSQIEAMFCGIGLNVNEPPRADLPEATSLFVESGNEMDRWRLLEDFLIAFEQRLELLERAESETLRKDYLDRLRWKDENHQFLADGMQIAGCIRGIDDHGRLLIESGGRMKAFGLKEISFIH